MFLKRLLKMIINKNPVMIEWRRDDGLLGVVVAQRVHAMTVALTHPKAVKVYAIDPELLPDAKLITGGWPYAT